MSSNILYATIAGWGEVSSVDDSIATVLSADNTAGQALLSVTSPATLSADEIGSQVWIEGLTGLVDGYYTLYAYFPVSSNGIAFISGDPDNFSLSAGANPASIRIEDFYKISTGVPDWVIGTNARARWYAGMTDVTPSLSSEIDQRGGIAKSDGITFSHTSIYNGLDKVRWNIMNTDGSIQTSHRVWDPDELTGIRCKFGIPYMASYDNPNTAPSDGVYEPTWWGSECIRVDSASSLGGDEYSLSMTRGLLKTEPNWHSYGELFIDGMTTPAGKLCEIRYLTEDSSDYSGQQFVFDGVITGISYSENGLVQNIQISDNLLQSKQREAAGQLVATAKWYGDSFTDRRINIIQQSRGFTWDWIKVGDVCLRLSTSETSSYNNFSSIENQVPDEAYGYVLSTQQAIKPLKVDQQTVNAILVELQSSDDDWKKYNRPLEFNTELAGLGDDSEERQDFYDREDLIYYSEADEFNGTPPGEPYISTAKLKKSGAKLEPAHVFENNEFGPEYPLFNGTVISDRRTGANPVEVILQILLTKTGNSSNKFEYDGKTWDFDVLTPELGLGLDASKIDAKSFLEAAQFFDENKMWVWNAFITASESPKLDKWITDNILKPFLLSICVDNNGNLRLTRLTDSGFKSSLVTLDNSDLYFNSEGEGSNVIELVYDTSNLLQSITAEFQRPWFNPNNPQADKIFNFKYANDGIAAQYNSLGNSVIKIKTDFCFLEADSHYRKWGNYYGRYLGNYRVAIPTLTCYVYSDFSALVGEYIYVDLDNIPNALGTTATNMQGVGLILSRKTDITYGVDQLVVAIVETTNLDPVRAFAASGEVASVSSNTVFTIEADSYIPSDLSPYDSDASSFQEGDYILLYDQNFVLRSFDGFGIPGPRKITSIAGNVITIASPFTSITPSVNDIIMLSEESDQTTATAQNYMYIYDNRVDQYQFE